MIYYPLETLAGMGIREVLVIVGGKSVGDVVELLGDGAHFGLSLTYRYQRGALGIAHAIGLAREFVGRDPFCVVLGDNILRGARARAGRARLRGRPVGRRDAPATRCADPERFGVAELDAGRAASSASRRSRHGPEEQPDPDRRLLPAPRRLRRDRRPRAVRPWRARDHRRPQPLRPRRRPLRAALRGALDRRRHRVVAPARRRARRRVRGRGSARAARRERPAA